MQADQAVIARAADAEAMREDVLALSSVSQDLATAREQVEPAQAGLSELVELRDTVIAAGEKH